MRAECGPRTSSAISRAISRISRCSRKKPERPWWRISASSSSSRVRASPRCGEAAVAPLQLERADLRQLGVGHGVVGRRVAVAEVAGEVEAQPVGELGRLARSPRAGRRTAAPSRAGSSARARGCRAARPRRPRAGDASGWRRARPAARPGAGRARARRWWRTTRSPSGARALEQARGCARGRRATAAAAARRAGRPGRTPRRARGRAASAHALVGVHERALARAARQADEPLGALAQRGQRRCAGTSAVARVRGGQQLREVGVARARLDEQRDVERRRARPRPSARSR